MKSPVSAYEDFDFDSIYHIYSQVSGQELIFREERNYHFFLEKVSKYFLPVVDIYAYCLLPKQFDFLIGFKSKMEICSNQNVEEVDMDAHQTHKFLMKNFSNFLNSYAKAYNKTYGRKGALFIDYLKRVKIDDEELLKSTFIKIHQQPLLSCVNKDYPAWKFSSFKTYYSSNETKLDRKFMSSFFEGKDDYIRQHQIRDSKL